MSIAGRYVAPLFVKPEDTELLALSVAGMNIFSFSYLIGWVDMCFFSFFTALERPVRSLLTSLFGTLVFPIVSLALLTPIWQLDGVWMTSIVSGIASAIFTTVVAMTMKAQETGAD